MKIGILNKTHERYVGGTVTVAGKSHQIKKIGWERVGHDSEARLTADDGTVFILGYSEVSGVEHEGKFYIGDDGESQIILSPKVE